MNAPVLIDPTLDALAAEINAAHTEAQAFSSQAVERALVAGDLLNRVKTQLKHGEFSDWCKAHCPAIGQRRLQEYMRVARELPIEIRGGAYLGLNEAIRLVTPKTPTKKPAQKRLPAPAKTATGGAYLPKPEPPRIVSKPGTFEAALVPVAKLDGLDLSFPPPPPKKPLTQEQEFNAECEAARRKHKGLPEPELELEPSPESLGFVGIAAMQQLNERFDDLLDRALSGPETLGFQRVLRPIEELRDFMPEYLKTTEQAHATVDLLEILTQQARLRLAWLESHPEPQPNQEAQL
jgi:hypothetical protein